MRGERARGRGEYGVVNVCLFVCGMRHGQILFLHSSRQPREAGDDHHEDGNAAIQFLSQQYSSYRSITILTASVQFLLHHDGVMVTTWQCTSQAALRAPAISPVVAMEVG